MGFIDLASRLADDPANLVRKDARFKALDLDASDYQTPATVGALLAEYPELTQRPLIDDGTTVIIARPPSRAAEWIEQR